MSDDSQQTRGIDPEAPGDTLTADEWRDVIALLREDLGAAWNFRRTGKELAFWDAAASAEREERVEQLLTKAEEQMRRAMEGGG